MAPSHRVVLVLVLASSGLLHAQTPPPAASAQKPGAASPGFDVVSIKENHTGDVPRVCGPPDGAKCRRTGTWMLNDMPVDMIIRDAYGDQIAAGPDWMHATRFDFQFKLTPSVSDDQFRQMLRATLANRFHLVGHMEARDAKVVPMRIAAGGLKLQPASGDCAALELIQPDGPVPCGGVVQTPARYGFQSGWLALTARSVSMDDLAAWVRSEYGWNGPVVNETGATGRYDLDVKFYVTPVDQSRPENYALNLEDATQQLQKALLGVGLELDLIHPVKRPTPTFVIDSISPPTPD